MDATTTAPLPSTAMFAPVPVRPAVETDEGLGHSMDITNYWARDAEMRLGDSVSIECSCFTGFLSNSRPALCSA
jgi:hypothetical protein